MAEVEYTPEQIDEIGEKLNDGKLPLAARFRALFVLRNVKDDKSVQWIGKAFSDPSALLKHELAYCLGQMQNSTAIPVLNEVLADTKQEPMVRHEAGEALGAIGDKSSIEILKKYAQDLLPEIAETCELAYQRIEWIHSKGEHTNSPYDSVDPTPSHTSEDVAELKKILVDPSQPLFERYKTMFKLRNINNEEAILALGQGLHCPDSALFRHEVAYVLGQIQSPLSIPDLAVGLKNPAENCMVRHECAEALGAIATPESEALVHEYAKDIDEVVRESCEVAIDMKVEYTPQQIDEIGEKLNDGKLPLAARFRALFVLRNVKDDKSVQWIGKAFSDPSALLKHELAYCLGQMQNSTAIPVLNEVLADTKQEPMVRHEAGEALGAIGDKSSIEILKKYAQDPLPEIAETCELAYQRIEWIHSKGEHTNSPYDSVDPTPSHTSEDVAELKKILVDPNQPLFERYKTMFKLRNINNEEAILALGQGLHCPDSALFRHEVAYVLGQIQSPLSIPDLAVGLKNPAENCMVRHECAEALGAIATPESEALVHEYAKDIDEVVRESCEVAIDMSEYEKSGAFEYAA
uniref:Deoxyhypusine hydroxylase n=1 Tax=Panagrellus redivivus TaxID=6233 RepID=A0A7E4USI2_PANRE